MPMTYEHRAPIQCIFYSRDGKTMKRRMRFLGRESDHQKISFDLTCTQFINYPHGKLIVVYHSNWGNTRVRLVQYCNQQVIGSLIVVSKKLNSSRDD